MTKKTVAIVAAILLFIMLIFVLVSCVNTGSSETTNHGIDSGVVTKSSKGKIAVREDDGETDTHRVSTKVAKKCVVGKRWPDCKK